MPTATIQVAAVTSPDQWTSDGAYSKVVAVVSPDDDLTTLIYSLTSGQGEQYSLAASGLSPSVTINSVSVRSRCTVNHATNDGLINVSLWQGANSSTSSDHVIPHKIGGVFQWVVSTDSLPRPSGGTWTVADLAALQVQITNRISLVDVCTSLWIIVDYSPPGSSAMFVLFPY